MADPELKWPFGASDGGPDSRPLIVDLENVLVAMLGDAASAQRAAEALRGIGFTDETLRLYTSEQILAYDNAFRAGRGMKDRVVSAVVDDATTMGEYVA